MQSVTFQGVTVEVPDGYELVIDRGEIVRLQPRQDYVALMKQITNLYGSALGSGATCIGEALAVFGSKRNA